MSDFSRSIGGKRLGKNGAKKHRIVIRCDSIEGITKPVIRKLARTGGKKKLPDIPYQNDLSLREGDIIPFLQQNSIKIKEGVINIPHNFKITQEQLGFFTDKYFNDPNFKEFLHLCKLSEAIDEEKGYGDNQYGIFMLDSETIKDFLEFTKKDDDFPDFENLFIENEYNDYSLLLLATTSEQTIELELEIFKNGYSNINFIEHKIIHNADWIRYPMFIKLEKLDGTLFFSNIFFKSKFGIENMCLSYKCQCHKCSGIKDDVKLELKGFLEEKYEQHIHIENTGNFCSKCTRETIAMPSEMDGTFVCYNCVGKPRFPLPPHPRRET
jgi:hypothetical protein